MSLDVWKQVQCMRQEKIDRIVRILKTLLQRVLVSSMYKHHNHGLMAFDSLQTHRIWKQTQ